MKSVSKFDQDYTDILCHGKKHLTKVLCLLFYLVCGIAQLSQFCYTIYKKRNLCAKFLLQFLAGHPGIFYRIMKKTCNNCFLVQFEISKDDRNAQWMNDIRLS